MKAFVPLQRLELFAEQMNAFNSIATQLKRIADHFGVNDIQGQYEIKLKQVLKAKNLDQQIHPISPK